MEKGAPPASREDYAAMVRRFAPTAGLVAVERLTGGSSAETVRLDLAHTDGRVERLISRRHSDINHANEPEIAAFEHRILTRLHGAGLPVQPPRHVDREGVFAARPAVVVGYLDGAPILEPAEPIPFVEAMAELLAQVHAVGAGAFGFLHTLDDDLAKWLAHPARVPDETMHQTRLREALQKMPAPPRVPTLLHGDFWPGNLLWRDGDIVGLIDWEDAAIGDPCTDLAVARLELFWSLGEAAMTAFTDRYHAVTGLDRAGQPYWDLFACWRSAGRLGSWGFEGEAEVRARACQNQMVESAFAALG